MQHHSRRRRVAPWVGPWLKEKREKHGTSVEEVRAKLGRSQPAVSRMESGASSIAADDLPAVLAAYDVSESQFANEARKHREAA